MFFQAFNEEPQGLSEGSIQGSLRVSGFRGSFGFIGLSMLSILGVYTWPCS